MPCAAVRKSQWAGGLKLEIVRKKRREGPLHYESERHAEQGPRVMITREGLERTGLMLPGSRASERFLFRLSPHSPGIEQTRASLKAAFPDALIADYRESHPIVTQGLNRATTFLSLVSLITLIIGAIGVVPPCEPTSSSAWIPSRS